MIYGKTDTGKVRDTNQDVFAQGLLGKDACYVIICDGMGGVNAGNVASNMACHLIAERIKLGYREGFDQNRVRSLLMTAVTAANVEIYHSSTLHPEYTGMGTTVIAAILQNSILHLAHVGDSRAYIINRNEFVQITRDHSLVQELLEQGKISDEDAKHHPQKNLITRAVGVSEKVCADYLETTLNDEDRVLFCTDGLTNYCDANEIYRISLESPPSNVPDYLISAANNAGGSDNITAVLLVK